jgi:hypothetical protein
VKITKNITQIEDKAKFKIFQMKEDFSDRLWFIGPMKDGVTHSTALFQSKTTGALAVTVSTPIVNKKAEIRGILGADIRFEDLIKSE